MISKLKAYYISHKGKVRANNEDSIRIGSILINDSQIDEPKLAEINVDSGLWLAVADGLGGHSNGEVASGVAVSAIDKLAETDLIELNQKSVAKTLLQELQSRIELGDVSANLGTTLSALYIMNHSVYLIHIGDSRIYSLLPFQRLTKDDSVIEQLIDQGQISESMRKLHPLKNQLTHAIVGSSSLPVIKVKRLSLDLNSIPIQFLLCTDGLWENFDNQEIEQKFHQLLQQDSNSLLDFSNWLFATAMERGANDNISFILVSLY